ncbi:MAG: diaminobutyrate acetyltransferase [Methylococcales bacterium]|nr:diaminobutyrate acetyltransferase [Methylococcales bacterium]
MRVVNCLSERLNPEIVLRRPNVADGPAVFNLIASCPPLDTNSRYCNLLQCHHFASTSVAAFLEQTLVGFVSGYLLPERADTLFVWQVAVADSARGQGLASRMLQHILARAELTDVRFIETTITDTNRASWALFERLAQSLDTSLQRSLLLERNLHFDNQHDSEFLARLGPLAR